MIIGAKGIALSNVIREYETSEPTVLQTWGSMTTLAAHHGVSVYEQHKITVHNIIIQNIADGYNAYTYVKPHIKIYNGRRYIKALQGR